MVPSPIKSSGVARDGSSSGRRFDAGSRRRSEVPMSSDGSGTSVGKRGNDVRLRGTTEFDGAGSFSREEDSGRVSAGVRGGGVACSPNGSGAFPGSRVLTGVGA